MQTSFKVVHWMTIGTSNINILGIYHPPYSKGQKITNAMFLDDLTEFLTDWVVSYRNIIICSDFNIHIDNPSDTEAQFFMGTMEAFGLQQHVNFLTHLACNMLDLIFTEATSLSSIKTFKGRYVSDHRVIVSELSIGIQHITGKTVTFRNLKQINVEESESTLDLGITENMRPGIS